MSLRDELGGPLLTVPDLEELGRPRKQLEAVRAEKNASDGRLTELLRVELPAAEEADRLKFARRLSKDAAGAADPGDHAAQ